MIALAVLGAGGVGGFVAAALSHAGGDVTVVVRPEAIGLCGSDFHYFHGDLGSVSDDELYPRIQGHEFSAIVEDVGPGCPAGIATGQRVAVWPVIALTLSAPSVNVTVNEPVVVVVDPDTALTPVGAAGEPTITAPDAADAGPVPTTFVAVTVKV